MIRTWPMPSIRTATQCWRCIWTPWSFLEPGFFVRFSIFTGLIYYYIVIYCYGNYMTTLTQNSISPRELHLSLLEGSAPEILDVRTPAEYEAEHIPGTRLVPLDKLDVSAFLKQHGKKPLYVLCQSG